MDQSARSIKAVFDHALEIDTPAERQAYLDDACAGRPQLRAHVESLLSAYAAAGSFLDQPAAVALDTPVGAATPVPAVPGEAPGEAPGTCLGPYQLLQKIGEGGMGTVWRAEQQVPVRREVALKVVKPGLGSAGMITRFEAERQALALMDHPHIAKVLDAGETPPAYAGGSPRPYFVMELVPGVPITQFCDEQRLSLRQRLELLIPVCQAVQHAHQKGVIHRDLKPSNVLVALYDGRPLAKVIDFGIAKATGVQLTQQTLNTTFGTVVGTLEYMAPEQAELNALDIDTRADLYSLGVLLYELLTGTTPRRGRLKDAGLLEVLRLIREQEPERPSIRLSAATAPEVAAARATEPAKLAKAVRGELDWIVLKCLEKDRNRRYETANGLARDLQRYLANEPVAAGPPGAGYRLRKFVRRHRGPVLAAAVVLLALVAGITGTTWGLVRAERERQAALREKRIAVAVRSFLQHDLLDQADPRARAVAQRHAGGRVTANPDPTIKELLDLAAARLAADTIAAKFPEEPVLQASILQTVGDTYCAIGIYDKAAEFLSRASDLYRQALGPDHPDTLTSLNNLAGAYWAAGQLDKAVPLYEQTLAKKKEVLGPDHPSTLSTMNNLANAYRDAGQIAKAVALHEQTLAKRRETLGPDHPDTLLSVNNLALAYTNAGQLAKALPLFEQTLAKQQEVLGPDHPDTLLSVNNLASAYDDTGQLDKALPLYEQALAKYQATHGPDHPRTLQSTNNLAQAYKDAGRFDEALPLFEQALAKTREKLGPDHPDTLILVNNLAFAYQATGQLTKALPLFEQTLPRVQKRLGPEHPFTVGVMNNLAVACQQQGDFAQAERLLRESLNIRRRTQPSSWATFHTQSLLGGNLLGQKHYTEAEPLLLAGYQGMKERETTIPRVARKYLTEALERLVQLYDAWGKKDQADLWRQRLPARTDPNSP